MLFNIVEYTLMSVVWTKASCKIKIDEFKQTTTHSVVSLPNHTIIWTINIEPEYVLLSYSAGCMGMVALGREDIESQNKIAEQGGIQPLVRLLRSHKTSERVLLTVIKVIGTLCLGE